MLATKSDREIDGCYKNRNFFFSSSPPQKMKSGIQRGEKKMSDKKLMSGNKTLYLFLVGGTLHILSLNLAKETRSFFSFSGCQRDDYRGENNHQFHGFKLTQNR